VVPVLVDRVFQGRPGLFVDTSCGTNALAQKLFEGSEGSIRSVSFDVDTSRVRWGTAEEQSWFDATPVATEGHECVVAGFNPPFGIQGSTAKRFVQHTASVLRPDYMVWLLPHIGGQWVPENYIVVHRDDTVPEDAFFDQSKGRPFRKKTTLWVLKYDPVNGPLQHAEQRSRAAGASRERQRRSAQDAGTLAEGHGVTVCSYNPPTISFAALDAETHANTVVVRRVWANHGIDMYWLDPVTHEWTNHLHRPPDAAKTRPMHPDEVNKVYTMDGPWLRIDCPHLEALIPHLPHTAATVWDTIVANGTNGRPKTCISIADLRHALVNTYYGNVPSV
jgi:hypothetical protein